MSNLILAFDTETTSLPEWKKPSGDECQPHLVSLAAILVDADSRKELQSINLIVKPEGWVIPDESIEIHGITNEMANEVGLHEATVVSFLLGLWNNCKRVAHNKTFDQRLIRIALKRYGFLEVDIERWAEKDNFFCTMYGAKPIVKQPNVGRAGIKNPKLEEAYRFFTGNEPKNAHNAMADTRMCLDVYFGIIDHNK